MVASKLKIWKIFSVIAIVLIAAIAVHPQSISQAPGFPGGSIYDVQYNNGGKFGGPAVSGQLADFRIIRTSSTRLTIGPYCSSATPCNFGFGPSWTINTGFYSLTSPALIDITGAFSASSGVNFYLDAVDGMIHAWSSSSLASGVTCTNCVLDENAGNNFNSVGISIGDWLVTVAGVWDAAAVELSPAPANNGGSGFIMGHNTDISDGNDALAGTFTRINDSTSISWVINSDGTQNNITPSTIGFSGTKVVTSCATISGGVPSGCSNVTNTYINGLLQ